MKKLALIIFALLVLLGCAKTSGVVSLGDGTYVISRTMRGVNAKGSKLSTAVYDEAYLHCESLGKNMMKINKQTENNQIPYGEPAKAEIEFQCL